MKYYKSQDEHFETKGPYRLQPLATTSNDERPNLRYPITADDGQEIWPEKQWQWSRERVEEVRADNGLVIAKRNGNYTVSYKQYLFDDSGEERKAKPKSIISGHYTQHGTYESIELFGMEAKFAFPKPEGLIERVLQSCTAVGDLMLDSFIGSGTSVAVAHKMKRRYIGIEMGEHAITHCLPRLKKVIEGEQGGISKSVGWERGGGFKFLRLGEPVFDERGAINPKVRFTTLASFIWLQETGLPADQRIMSPLLGVHGSTAYYLLYNGILGDKRPESGNVLTGAVLRAIEKLKAHDGPKIIYGEKCSLGDARLREAGVTFKHIPYEVRAR